MYGKAGFNTQPPEGGWFVEQGKHHYRVGFNTQPPEGGWLGDFIGSRVLYGFNTQPPEGGWFFICTPIKTIYGFNTQPPEGGWRIQPFRRRYYADVSTHSRPKAAGSLTDKRGFEADVSTHSRPKAAGPIIGSYPCFWAFQHTAARRRLEAFIANDMVKSEVSTHSRPKAAGILCSRKEKSASCFNTQPPEGGWRTD